MTAPSTSLPKTLTESESDGRRSFFEGIAAASVALPEAEVRAHFEGMPYRYWQRVNRSELVWSLETIHTFLETVVASDAPAWTPIVDWRHFPARGFSKVMVCTWDRRSLLVKIAAAFSAVGINIIRADVYTRADNVVLDVFRVCQASRPVPPDTSQLRQMAFLLEGALSDPPRFASVWAGEFHKFLPWTSRRQPLVMLDNNTSREFTLLTVEASDRIGLLYDLLRTLDGVRLNVAQADIDTEDGVASDTFYLADESGLKIVDNNRLRLIAEAVHNALLPPLAAA